MSVDVARASPFIANPDEPALIDSRPFGEDSTGQLLGVGDRVRCRGGLYTVIGFPMRLSSKRFSVVSRDGLDGALRSHRAVLNPLAIPTTHAA